ncbi:MAG: DUF2334 domain-containing protein [Lachnospiraceae bacterium]|nr:DUF2334 domain-containing protein [Candidatus Colinaster equi]
MECIIRLDDITPDMDWEKFYHVKDILDKYNVKPLIGVVPDNQDGTLHFGEPEPDFWEIIQGLADNGWVIAQHGTTHVYETTDAGILGINPFSEFAGLPYSKQLGKLRAGQKILSEHGIETDIFMAPGHTFDDETIEALKECGFSAVTDGLYTNSYLYKDVLFVPCSLGSKYEIEGIDTICLHTNLMKDDEFDKLESFLQLHQSEVVTFEPDILRLKAILWNSRVRKYERKKVADRKRKAKVAASGKLSWYMSYTNDKNSKVKWMKRVLYLPLLATNKYKKSN